MLSSREFNEKTSLVLGLPMSTAAYNASNPFAVVAGKAGGGKGGQASYVLCHQPKSFDWRLRGAKPHPNKRMADDAFAQACGVLDQILALR